MNFLKMTDLDLAGKRVFIRADLNVQQDDAGTNHPFEDFAARRCRTKGGDDLGIS